MIVLLLTPTHTHHFFDLSLGAGLRGMRKRALIGCMSHSAEEAEKKENRWVRANVFQLIALNVIEAYSQSQPE